MSTQAAGLVRADDGSGSPAPPDDPDAGRGEASVGGPVAAAAAADAGGGRLVVPLDLDEASDSAFLRRLLLSHGIELELGDSGVLERDAFVALVERLRVGGAAALVGPDGDGLDVELVPEEAFDLTLAIDVDEELSHFARDRPDGADGWLRQRFLLEGVVLPADPREAPTDVASPPVPPPPVGDCPVPRALLDAFAATFDGSAPSADDAALHARLHEALAPSLAGVVPAPVADRVSEDWRERWLTCPIVLPEPIAPVAPMEPAAAEPPAPPGGNIVGVDAPPDDALSTGSVPRAPPAIDGPPNGVVPPGAPGIPEDGPRGPDAPLFTVSDELPPGFEGLGGPLVQFVDVYFNGRKRGDTTVTVTADELVLDAPEEVLAMLEEVIDGPALLPVLSAPLRTNANRRCLVSGDPPGCGSVDTDSVAVLYDENALRLDVFVAPGLQAAAGLDAERYVRAPEPRPSAIVSLGAVTSELDGRERALDANGGLIVGYGATHLRARADYTSRTEAARLREFRLARYVGDYEIGLGSFGFSPGAGLLDADLLGASVATSYATRRDRELAFATDLVVYLSRRSVVQLLVDGRIYHGDSYGAGNRSIDTAALPDGTYELEIRIVEDGGAARTETRLFTKGAELPPPGETVLAVTAGLPLFFDEPDRAVSPLGAGTTAMTDGGTLGDGRFLPSVGDVPVLGLSAARRAGDHSAWRAGLLQVGDVSVGQLEYLLLARRFSLQLAASAGTRGVLATLTTARVYTDTWSASVSHASSRSDFGPGDDPVFDRFFPGDTDQTQLAVGRTLGGVQLGARASRRTVRVDGARATSDEYTLFARRRLFARRGLAAFLEVELRRDDVEDRIGVQLRGHFGGEGFSGSARLGSGRRLGADEAADARWSGPAAAVGVSTSRRSAGTLRWDAGAHAETEDGTDSAGVRVGVAHPWAVFEASTDWRFGPDGRSSRSALASARAQIGIDGSGAAIGGIEYAQAGIIVDVTGEPAGERFGIRVGGADAGTGQVGRPRFIALAPFDAYSVRLVPESLLSNGIGEEVHEFTLYPGSVRRIAVQSLREVLLVASLADERGRPVTDAVVITRRGPALIDASGVFQAELSPGATVRVERGGVAVCEFDVPADIGDEEIVIPDRPLACRGLAGTDAPPPLGAATAAPALPAPAPDAPPEREGPPVVTLPVE